MKKTGFDINIDKLTNSIENSVTLGQAAEMVGYSKETFMELLADYNVSLINYPAEELDEDIENAQRHSI